MRCSIKNNRLYWLILFLFVFKFLPNDLNSSSNNSSLLIMQNPNVLILPPTKEELVPSFFVDKKSKMNKFFEGENKKYFFIFLGVTLYFGIAHLLNTWTKKIMQQKYYELLFLEDQEINAITSGKISINLNDMLLIKNLYNNIIKIEKYYYFMFFFAFFPFFHYNLKYILFNKKILLLNAKKIYESISIK